jgi:pyruvate/2-oxoacid:ferredoxin oxidoreductase alpha subunit
MNKSVRLYQSGELPTPEEKELAHKLAAQWQVPVFIYIDGERTVIFSQEKEGRREPNDMVFPEVKHKRQTKIVDAPRRVAVDDGSDLV